MAKMKDDWAQLAYIAVTESAANTLTFGSISVFSNILTPKAMVLHRVSYNMPTGTNDLLTAAGDALYFGLGGDDSIATIAMDDPKVYDYNILSVDHIGTAASGAVRESPIVVDWTALPGGGKLVPADRLYIYCQGENLGDVSTIQARIEFTLVDLNAQQYIELAQSLRILT